ncbi:RNA-binding protein 40-like, partial [Trifolium pratense]
MELPTPPLPPEVPAPPPPVPPHSVTAKQSLSLQICLVMNQKWNLQMRRGAIVGPAIDKDVAHEAVGLKPASLIPKEIPMIKKNPVLK